MSGREDTSSGSWLWMAGFAVLFGVLGVWDLAGGEVLTGCGLVVYSAGSGLFALGDRGARAQGRPWRVLGGAVSLVGIGLLAMGVFG